MKIEVTTCDRCKTQIEKPNIPLIFKQYPLDLCSSCDKKFEEFMGFGLNWYLRRNRK